VQQEPDAKFLMEELEIHLKQEDIPHGINISRIYGTTLCIPTVFWYTGEALDNKIRC
jgi:hypothetical protein